MNDDPVGSTYNARCAAVYDELFGAFEPTSVETLTALAGAGPALERAPSTAGSPHYDRLEVGG